eukprot:scaffold8450_cov215-Amphora_coffeaeformis.AAC.4
MAGLGTMCMHKFPIAVAGVDTIGTIGSQILARGSAMVAVVAHVVLDDSVMTICRGTITVFAGFPFASWR